MRKILQTGFLLFVFTILFSPTALAQNKIKVTPAPTAKPTIKLPVFMIGSSQVVDKPINGDLMISGGQINITSNVNGDTYVAGGQINIGGTINGNLIVAGGNITISAKVLKNIIVAGGQVKIDSLAEIGGYVLAGAGQVDLLGHFSGPVKVGAETLIVGEKAIIDGNLEADVSKSNISSTSKIIGETRIKIHEIKQQPVKQLNQWQQLGYSKTIFSFLSGLVVLLILVKLFGQKIRQIDTTNSIWPSIGLGLIVLITTPFVFLILMITVIGIPLSLITLAGYLVSLYLSRSVASLLIGSFISKKWHFKTDNYYLQGFIGLLLLTLIELIPFVGGLVKFIVLLLGLGIIFKNLHLYFSNK